VKQKIDRAEILTVVASCPSYLAVLDLFRTVAHSQHLNVSFASALNQSINHYQSDSCSMGQG